jgi:hypothetical protein
MPTNYIAFQGLRSWGYQDVAADLAQRSARMFSAAPFREYYAAETGAGRGRDPFWGWSGLALFMTRELEQRVDPTAVAIGTQAP